MPFWKWIIFIVLVLGLSLFLFYALKISSKSAREEERRIKYKKLGEIIKIAKNKLNLTLRDLSIISDISEIELWLLENSRIKNPKCVFLFSIIYIFISYS